MNTTQLPTIVRTCAEDIESVRRTVNQTSSEVPYELQSTFQAALDQIADQQYNVSKALSLFLQEPNTAFNSIELTLNAAVSEAQRSGLRACRGYADREVQASEDIDKELMKVPVNVSELEREKHNIAKRFTMAAALHENNRIEALDQLVSVATDYKEWRMNARATINGAAGIAAIEGSRAKMQLIAIWVAIAVGIANLIVFVLRR